MGLRPDQDIVADDCGVARRPRITAFSITMLRRGPTLISPVLGGQHGPDGTRASGSMRTAPPQRWLPGGSRRSPRFGRGADDVSYCPQLAGEREETSGLEPVAGHEPRLSVSTQALHWRFPRPTQPGWPFNGLRCSVYSRALVSILSRRPYAPRRA